MTGWTQTPNFIYDLMPEMKVAELKVVMAVSRQTAGWQRERATMRLLDIENITGLSHPSVVTGIKDAIDRGILGREVKGETFVYWLIEPCENDLTVKNFNTEDVTQEPESKEFLHTEVKKVNTETVKNLNTNKRNINTNKTKQQAEEIAANAAPPIPPTVAKLPKPKRSRRSQTPPPSDAPPKEPSEWQEFVGAFCWVCYGHMEVSSLTEAKRGALLSEAKEIHAKQFTKEDLREWYKRIWGQGWQYKRDKARPLPSEVRSSIAQLRAETPAGFEVATVVASPPTSNAANNRQAVANVFAKVRAAQGVNGHG